jgi:Uma2 family endonuclease
MVNSVIQLTEIQVSKSPRISLKEWMENPPNNTEWVDGELVEKNGMTAKTGRIQSRLSRYWGNYAISSGQGGEVYTETGCRTVGRGRCPDVSYLTPELVAQFNDFTILPQSFPLIAEIISPTDKAEEVFAKTNEYLQSSCQEIWLVFPESHWVIVITQQQRFLFARGEVISTQIVLPGFSIAVDELLA